MKVSYYLGAGASFGTIPIINELSLQLTHFAAELNKFEIHPEYKDQLKELSDSIFKISSRSSYFGSIDTFAQNLYFNRRNEGKISLSLIKTVISLYFSILQTEKNVHNRLIYFLTKIRKHLITSSQSLNPKIKFITWNYDFQLELALNELIFQMDDVRLLIDKLLIYPNQQSGNFINQEYQIIHLNGIAGLFDVIKTGENEIGSLFNRSNSKSREEIFWKMYFLFDSIYLNKSDLNRFMTFNWEESPNKEFVIKKSIEYLKNSDKIIVVGYSFPDDNRSFDLNWIDKIDNKTEIIIQNPANEIPFINELKERNIKYKIIKDVNKYYIPNELLI